MAGALGFRGIFAVSSVPFIVKKCCCKLTTRKDEKIFCVSQISAVAKHSHRKSLKLGHYWVF